ncbi:ChaN family lipoprotein [Endothiovibrio diazotrophicus]
MLERTEYFTRWRFDYRLYRPILHYARDHALPLVALNVPAELSRKVAGVGLAGLDAAERAQLPAEMGAADDVYRTRLRGIFEQHPGAEQRNFDFFVDAQRVWDEGMAARVADYLSAHPGRRMVVLAGVGHIAYRGAIPDLVARRGGFPAAVVACDLLPSEAEAADFVLYPQPVPLPAAGMLGVFLDERPDGVYAKAFSPQSAAQAAGMREGDRIVAIADGAVGNLGELKSRMFDRRPGETVSVEVEHHRFLLAPQRKRFEVTLR